MPASPVALSTAFARGLVEALEAVGITREELLRGSSMTLSDLANPNLFLDGAVLDALVERAVRLSQDPALGLSWYERASFATFGAVGQALGVAASFRAGLGLIERYWPLFMSRELLRVHEQAGQCTVVLQRASTSSVAHRAYMESSLFVLCRMLRQCAGVAGLPSVVQLDYPAPSHAPRYQAVFRCPVAFEAEVTAMRVAAPLAAHPNLNAAPELEARLRSYADVLLEAHRGDTLSIRVLAFLRVQADLQRVAMEPVAGHLGISERTLRRRLQNEGTSFPLLVQRALCERAASLLEDPGRSVKEVAFALGFADPSAFHRAFRRWTGKAPGELRTSSRPPPRGDGTEL